MPNWCSNYIEIKGSKGVIKKALTFVKTKNEDKEDCFDFNNLIPMPQEYVGLESGSREPLAIACYIAKERKDMTYFEKNMRAGYFNFMIKEASVKKKILEKDITSKILYDYMEEKHSEYFELGKRYCECEENFGYKDWYEWCLGNWETKWNACRSEFSENSVRFETAWNSVVKLIQLWASLFPSLTFSYYFSDEQMGIGTGQIIIKGGEIVSEYYYNNLSSEAFECSDIAWGYEVGSSEAAYNE